MSRTFQLSASAALVLSLFASATQAAEHQLSKIHYDSARNVNVLDMVMSIDWDIDTPPEGRDKAFLEGILRQSSQSLFTMTEGKQMLGTVYVYKNGQFMGNTDIQYLLKDGRANASVASFITGCKSCRVQQFAGTGETPVDHGKTVAHEFGHYVLGLLDEYREVGGTSTAPSSPQDGDTPRDSIMHNHLGFTNISTTDDYADPANQKTAQFRFFGKSAWDVLVTDPASDPTNIGRTYFAPFKNMTAPTKATLTKPTTGWENDLKIVYMGGENSSATPKNTVATTTSTPTARGPINIIVIDTSVSVEILKAQLNAAAQMIDASGDSNRIAVYAHPFTSTPIVPMTALSSAEKRASVKQAIAKIAADTTTDEKTIGDRIFDWAETQLPSFFPAGVTTQQNIPGWNYRVYATGKAVGVSGGNLFAYDGANLVPLGAVGNWLAQTRGNLSASLQKALDAVKAVRTAADTPSVSLFTNASQTVDNGVVEAFKTASVAINPVVLNAEGASAAPRLRSTVAGKTSMYDAAKGTAGNFKEASKLADLSKVAGKAANAAEGDEIQVVNESGVEKLTSTTPHTMSSVLTAGIDKQAMFSVFTEDDDANKVSFSLTAPNGTVITPQSLPTGVTYSADAEEGSFTYTVNASYAGFSGTWKSTASTTATTGTQGAVAQAVEVASPLGAGWDVVGGTLADTRPMSVMVEVSGPVAVTGASVKADIISMASGAAVRSDIALLDDGKGVDLKAGDGTYSVSLADLPVGEYEIQVKIGNSGSAVYSTAGNTKQGTNTTPQSVGAFQRVVYDVFVKER